MHLFKRSLLTALALASPLAHAAPPAACKPGQAIHDSGYVKIGGIEQWISIDGADCAKPALLLVHGGPGNPLGARAMNLGGTVYRIHGTNAPETIGQAVSSGCFRLVNDDVIDLYSRVPVGTKVMVQHQ